VLCSVLVINRRENLANIVSLYSLGRNSQGRLRRGDRLRLQLGAVELLKSGRDALAVAAGADAAWLRSRATALTGDELREWRRVWGSVS